MNLQQKGSKTAKEGFRNEDDIVSKFNNWKSDSDARAWLEIMEYNLIEIESVSAVKVHGYKTDVQVHITIFLKNAIDAENLQVKLVSNPSGFNQIDKRWINNYAEMWDIPDDIVVLLKLYSGEEKPNIESPKDKRRMYINEFYAEDQQKILKWFTDNKSLIISDILKGCGRFAAEWMLVAQKTNKNARWILKSMNYCMNFYGKGDVHITKNGNLRIGQIGMQRKGGDAGRKSASMLQFKINPAALFNLDN